MMSLLKNILYALVSPVPQPPMVGTNSASPAPTGLQSTTSLTFEETVAQMSRGYENTQRVVQFMDAKAGAVIALSIGIFILAGKLVVGVHDRLGEGMLTAHKAPLCCMLWGMTILVLCIGVAGFVCLHLAFRAVRPNGLPLPEHFSTLFPAADKPWNNPTCTTYLRKLVSGESQRFALREFEQQLLAMGGIVYLKIKSLRSAIRALWWQGLFAFLLLVFIGVVVGCGLYPKKVETPQKPVPVIIVPAN